MTDDKKFLLIGGSGRSGTTILCKTMSQHPDLTDVPEWRFMTDPDGVVDFVRQSLAPNESPFHYDRRVKRLERVLKGVTKSGGIGGVLGAGRLRGLAQRLSGRNLAPLYARTDAQSFAPNFTRLSDEFLARLRRETFEGYWVGMAPGERAQVSVPVLDYDEIIAAAADFLRGVAADVCAYQTARWHLEKNTWNILWFDRILEILPEAKLIHIYRDPRDVCCSFANQSWMPDDRISASRVYQRLMDRWFELRARLPEGSFMELSLESLTADPERYFHHICDFWGVPFHGDLLAHQLTDASFGRWRKELSDYESTAINLITEQTRQMYDYDSADTVGK